MATRLTFKRAHRVARLSKRTSSVMSFSQAISISSSSLSSIIYPFVDNRHRRFACKQDKLVWFYSAFVLTGPCSWRSQFQFVRILTEQDACSGVYSGVSSVYRYDFSQKCSLKIFSFLPFNRWSFGVLLYEILTVGRKHHLTRWVNISDQNILFSIITHI